jgi:hypothetical protein
MKDDVASIKFIKNLEEEESEKLFYNFVLKNFHMEMET